MANHDDNDDDNDNDDRRADHEYYCRADYDYYHCRADSDFDRRADYDFDRRANDNRGTWRYSDSVHVHYSSQYLWQHRSLNHRRAESAIGRR